MSGMLTCKAFVQFLADYLAGELSLAEQEAFNTHLAICPSCVAYMKTYQETIRMGKAALDATEEPVPQEVPEELVRAILASRSRRT